VLTILAKKHVCVIFSSDEHRSELERKRAQTSTCSELEMLRPGSDAGDVTSGADTLVD